MAGDSPVFHCLVREVVEAVAQPPEIYRIDGLSQHWWLHVEQTPGDVRDPMLVDALKPGDVDSPVRLESVEPQPQFGVVGEEGFVEFVPVVGEIE